MKAGEKSRWVTRTCSGCLWSKPAVPQPRPSPSSLWRVPECKPCFLFSLFPCSLGGLGEGTLWVLEV